MKTALQYDYSEFLKLVGQRKFLSALVLRNKSENFLRLDYALLKRRYPIYLKLIIWNKDFLMFLSCSMEDILDYLSSFWWGIFLAVPAIIMGLISLFLVVIVAYTLKQIRLLTLAYYVLKQDSKAALNKYLIRKLRSRSENHRT